MQHSACSAMRGTSTGCEWCAGRGGLVSTKISSPRILGPEHRQSRPSAPPRPYTRPHARGYRSPAVLEYNIIVFFISSYRCCAYYLFISSYGYFNAENVYETVNSRLPA